jgi:hypothetical protein
MPIPTIDPKVKYRGVSELRKLNAERLADLDGLLVIQNDDEPIAVIVPYETFIEMQNRMAIWKG